MAGYEGERVPQMQRRMLDAVAAIPGVTSVGFISKLPLSLGSGDSYVYTDTPRISGPPTMPPTR